VVARRREGSSAKPNIFISLYTCNGPTGRSHVFQTPRPTRDSPFVEEKEICSLYGIPIESRASAPVDVQCIVRPRCNQYTGVLVGTSPFDEGSGKTNVATQVVPIILKTHTIGTAVGAGGILTTAAGQHHV
jgi:hypothetical protein